MWNGHGGKHVDVGFRRNGLGWENRCVDESTAMATRVGRGPGDELKWGRTRARRDGNRDRVHAKGMYIHSDLRESE